MASALAAPAGGSKPRNTLKAGRTSRHERDSGRTSALAAAQVGEQARHRTAKGRAKERLGVAAADGHTISLFPGLKRLEVPEVRLDAVQQAAPQAAVEPFDLALMSVDKLQALLKKLTGSHDERVTSDPDPLSQARALADCVREAMAEAPLALIDEVCADIDAAARAHAAATRGVARRGSSGHGAAGRLHGSRSSAHKASPKRRHGSAYARASSPSDTAAERKSGDAGEGEARRRRHGRHRESRSAREGERHGSEHRGERRHGEAGENGGAAGAGGTSSQARVDRRAERRAARLERRIAEALDPDQEAVEPAKAARRLERRINKALVRGRVADAFVQAEAEEGAPDSRRTGEDESMRARGEGGSRRKRGHGHGHHTRGHHSHSHRRHTCAEQEDASASLGAAPPIAAPSLACAQG
jgi:hypothetical protein